MDEITQKATFSIKKLNHRTHFIPEQNCLTPHLYHIFYDLFILSLIFAGLKSFPLFRPLQTIAESFTHSDHRRAVGAGQGEGVMKVLEEMDVASANRPDRMG